MANDAYDNRQTDNAVLAALATVPMTDEEKEPLPMPRGMTLLFQPLIVRGVHGQYNWPKLAEGECGQCGTPANPDVLSVELKPDGVSFYHQCSTCGCDNILAMYSNPRNNNNRKGA